MSDTSSKPTRITVSLAEKEHAALASIARDHDVSLSWVARKAITEFLKQHTTTGSIALPAHNKGRAE